MLPNPESRTLLALVNHILKQHPYLADAVAKIACTVKDDSRYEALLARGSIEDKFVFIYKTNWWKSGESRSGPGSTLEYTHNLRSKIPEIIQKYSIKTILDAPCGDFNWMSQLIHSLDVDYVGGDIVGELINVLHEKNRNNRVKFIQLDITRDKLPLADLMIVRDCLFHFSYKDSWMFFNNFITSRIPYLLTTTHKNDGNFQNKDIITGEFKLIDLFSDPYNFEKTPLYSVDDWVKPDPEREMVLFSAEQVMRILSKK
jgi:hypothetical protein